MIGYRYATVLLIVAAAPASALAQEGADIVVTGRGLDTRPGDKVADVVTIDAGRIAENAAGRLESVLADVAGLQQFRRSDSRSANPTSQGISLRGIGGNAASRALLILDGVPQADPFGGWVPFPAYATDRIGLIRVTRGGGSGYYGAGALAGTVELESAAPDARDPITASLAYGSRDSINAQGSASLARAAGFLTLSGAYARGDGFIPVAPEGRGAIDRAAPFEQASAAFRSVIDTGGRAELQTNVSAFTDSRERGTPFTANKSEGADASLRLVGRGEWGYSLLGYVQTRSFASEFAALDAARSTSTKTLDQYNTPATGLGARVEAVPPVGAGQDLRLGADIRALSGKTQELYTFVAGAPTRDRVAGGETRTVGVFADGSANIRQLTLALGGRVDWWHITEGVLRERTLATGAFINDINFPDREGAEVTGRAGIAWSPADAVTLRASAYRGWRLPTLNELHRPFRVGADATAANAALAPERLTGVESGVTLTPLPGASFAAAVFWNRLKDAIANVTAGFGPGTFPGVGFVTGVYRVRRNLDAVRSTGLEIDARYTIGQFFARASWSHVNSRVETSGDAVALDGLRPAQTPRDLVSATLGWRKATTVASTTLRRTARQFDDDQNTRVLAPATTLDGFVALPITRAFTIEARAENVFDTRVETGISGTGVYELTTPRTLWIGLRLRG